MSVVRELLEKLESLANGSRSQQAPSVEQLESELIVINHHVGDARKYIRKGEYKHVLGALDDIRESITRLEKLLPPETVREIERVTGDESPAEQK